MFRVFIILIFNVYLGLNSFSQNYFVVEDIEIHGTKRTKNHILLRELSFSKGDTISTSLWVDYKEMGEWRLTNLNLFNSVSIELQDFDSSKLVVIQVVERWYDWPIPFVSFADRNFNIWNTFDFDLDRTNYGFYLFNYNFLGLNHTLKTSFVKGYNQQLSFEYIAPLVIPSEDIGISAKISYNEQKEVWHKTRNNKLQFFSNSENAPVNFLNGYLKLHRRYGAFIDVAYGFIFRRIQVSDSFSSVAENLRVRNNFNDNWYLRGVNQQWQQGIMFNANYNMVDNINLPSRGLMWDFNTSVELISEIAREHYITNLRMEGMIQSHFLLKDRWFGMIGGKVIYNNNDGLPYSMQQILGYKHYLRGYESYVIDGQSGGLSKLGIKYQWLKQKNIKWPYMPLKAYKNMPVQSFIELFFDGGYVYNWQMFDASHFNILQNSFLFSTGIGLQTLFYQDQVLRIETSYNGLGNFGVNLHFERPLR